MSENKDPDLRDDSSFFTKLFALVGSVGGVGAASYPQAFQYLQYNFNQYLAYYGPYHPYTLAVVTAAIGVGLRALQVSLNANDNDRNDPKP